MVVGQCRVNLGKAELWVLPVDFFRAPSVSDVIANDFDDLDIGVIDPSTAIAVDHDVGVEFNCCVHAFDSHIFTGNARVVAYGSVAAAPHGCLRLGCDFVAR